MQLVDATMEVLRAEGFRHLVSVANYETEALRAEFEADADMSVTMACREGEAVAIASGLIASGTKTVLCIENLGLFESLDTLRAMPCDMGIPLPIFIGYCGRGTNVTDAMQAVGGMAGQLVLAGEWTEPVLSAVRIGCRVLLPDADETEVRQTLRDAIANPGPFAVLVDTFDRS